MAKFVDQVCINVSSGDGGNGMVAWRQDKYEPLGGPAGGDGGRGGSIFLEASPDITTLIDFRYQSQFKADDGGRGGPKGKYGRGGRDLIIKVPVGTIVRDLDSNKIIADLTEPEEKILVAQGGRGGKGNARLASATRRSPYFCEPGEPGIARQLELELKLLADVGIVGLPNAGKSSLLSVLTAAKPKIADYPFSTLEPNLGVAVFGWKRGGTPSGAGAFGSPRSVKANAKCEAREQARSAGYVIADIPGLIEGAAAGAGLGHKFLRHLERTRLLLHMVDISSSTICEDITTINKELAEYSERLSKLPRLMVLNKLDLVDEQFLSNAIDNIEKLIKQLKAPYLSVDGQVILTISCATTNGLEKLNQAIARLLQEIPLPASIHDIEPDQDAVMPKDTGFTVKRRRHVFTVMGDRVERLLAVTDLRSPESVHHLNQLLRSCGVIDALIKEGVMAGNTVIIGEASFVYGENLF